MEPEWGSGNTLLLQGQALPSLLPDHGEVWGSPGSVGAYGSTSLPEQQGQSLPSRAGSATKGLTCGDYLFHQGYQRMPLYSCFYFAFVYYQALVVGGGEKGCSH